MSIAFAALLALLPAQGGASPPPDPASDAPPPLVELAPSQPQDPAQDPAQDPTQPAEPPVLKPKPKPDAKPAAPQASQGIAQPAIAGIQIAVGTGACCAGCCLSVPIVVPLSLGLALVPVVGNVVTSMASNIIIGTSIGVAETWAGDAWGTQRAPMIWPVLASVGILTSATLLSTVASIVETPVVINPNDPNALAGAFAAGGLLTQISNYYGLFACVGAIALPAAVYAFTATDKQPGDTGSGFPGIMEPAHPPKPASTTTTNASATTAMLY